MQKKVEPSNLFLQRGCGVIWSKQGSPARRRQGDGAIPVCTMEIMAHDVKDHIASHKIIMFIHYAYILDIRDGSIYKMIPLHNFNKRVPPWCASFIRISVMKPAVTIGG